MAMGVSTQRSPFKPYLPSPPWTCPGSFRMKSFSASPKACHRSGLRFLLFANSPCSRKAFFRSSFYFERGSCSYTSSYSMEDSSMIHSSTGREIVANSQRSDKTPSAKTHCDPDVTSYGRSTFSGITSMNGIPYHASEPRGKPIDWRILAREVREKNLRDKVSQNNGGTNTLAVCHTNKLDLDGHSSYAEINQLDPSGQTALLHEYESECDSYGTLPLENLVEESTEKNSAVARVPLPSAKCLGGSTEKISSNSRDIVPRAKCLRGSTEKISSISSDLLSRGQHLQESRENISGIVEAAGVSSKERSNVVFSNSTETYIEPIKARHPEGHSEKLSRMHEKVLVVDNISMAKKIVTLLTSKYRHLVHACDTEVAKIDVKQETPVDHGEVICFSIYCGPEVDFGSGKSCIWVDVLDGGGRDMLIEFAPFFEDPSIKKVWHNYSFDSHILENYGLKLSGFHADTMHMARLWDSSRRIEGGYSLEALTSNRSVMSGGKTNEMKTSTAGEELIGKISMKTIFGKKKTRRDGCEGKIITISPVEELQREERIPWICYSALDSISTLKLFESLKSKLEDMQWINDGEKKGTMYDFYEEYWRPFGEILVKMETEGMLVDRAYLAEVEKIATSEQQIAGDRFRKWASGYCPDAMYMNVGSDTQLRQLFFGGIVNKKDHTELPIERVLKVPNVDKVIEEGKKIATKFRNIKLHKIGGEMQTEIFTASGWPSLGGDALKALAGKVSAEYDWTEDDYELSSDGKDSSVVNEEENDNSSYGTAYAAFGGGKKGREACHAIAALCEVCSIDSLISNFILPLQTSQISGKGGRVHCSLNINTETGRLSARRPNLQNQPALEKDRYKIRQAFVAAPGNSLVVADYGQLELRILAHLANCKSMLDAFKAGGDFHSRTAMNMYPYIREAVEKKKVLLEWHPRPGEEKPPVPLLKDAFASERRKAKMLNFSIAYGKTPSGLAKDWKVSVKEARETVDLWYKERKEVLEWQRIQKEKARKHGHVHTLLGRARKFPSTEFASNGQRGHIDRAAINTPVQGSAADVAMCAMLEISRNARLKELGWKLLLQVHDEVILEGPTESAEEAKGIVVECMSKPFYGTNYLKVALSVDANCAQNWYAAK